MLTETFIEIHVVILTASTAINLRIAAADASESGKVKAFLHIGFVLIAFIAVFVSAILTYVRDVYAVLAGGAHQRRRDLIIVDLTGARILRVLDQRTSDSENSRIIRCLRAALLIIDRVIGLLTSQTALLAGLYGHTDGSALVIHVGIFGPFRFAIEFIAKIHVLTASAGFIIEFSAASTVFLKVDPFGHGVVLVLEARGENHTAFLANVTHQHAVLAGGHTLRQYREVQVIPVSAREHVAYVHGNRDAEFRHTVMRVNVESIGLSGNQISRLAEASVIVALELDIDLVSFRVVNLHVDGGPSVALSDACDRIIARFVGGKDIIVIGVAIFIGLCGESLNGLITDRSAARAGHRQNDITVDDGHASTIKVMVGIAVDDLSIIQLLLTECYGNGSRLRSSATFDCVIDRFVKTETAFLAVMGVFFIAIINIPAIDVAL
jgi:hypothetical protein